VRQCGAGRSLNTCGKISTCRS